MHTVRSKWNTKYSPVSITGIDFRPDRSLDLRTQAAEQWLSPLS